MLSLSECAKLIMDTKAGPDLANQRERESSETCRGLLVRGFRLFRYSRSASAAETVVAQRLLSLSDDGSGVPKSISDEVHLRA